MRRSRWISRLTLKRISIALLLLVTIYICRDLLIYWLAPQAPFETFTERGTYGSVSGYEDRRSMLVLITRPEEVSALEGLLMPWQIEPLRSLDYEGYFALAVFGGSGRHKVDIKRITRIGDVVTVHAEFPDWPSGIAIPQVMFSAYQVVRIPKVGDWNQDIRFRMRTGIFRVVSVSHYIP